MMAVLLLLASIGLVGLWLVAWGIWSAVLSGPDEEVG